MNVYDALAKWGEAKEREGLLEGGELPMDDQILVFIVECHCFNHFPKLLEELKEAARITRLSNRTMAAIAAAEEVEGL